MSQVDKQPEAAQSTRLIVVLPLILLLFSLGSVLLTVILLHGVFNPFDQQTMQKLFQGRQHFATWWIMLLALVSVVIGVLLAKGIQEPLNKIASELEHAGSIGALARPVEIKTEKEITHLVGSFNRMLDGLQPLLSGERARATMRLDAKGAVLEASPLCAALFGIPRTQLIGRQWSELVPATPANAAFVSALRKTMETKRSATIETAMQFPDRLYESVALHFTSTPEGGTDIAFAVNLEELPNVREFAREVEKAATLISMGTMSAKLAHEIRNPLGAMMGFLSLLKQTIPQEDPKHAYIQSMLRSATRISRLVDDMLTVSTEMKLAPRPLMLEGLIRDTVLQVQPEFPDSPVQLRIENMEGVWVEVDIDRIQQAVSNLLRNAYQAMSAGGTVSVRCAQTVTSVDGNSSPTSFATIDVHNTGSYIPPEEINKVFNPFFSTKKNGAGLGLAVTRQILEKHGGAVQVTSSVEDGTNFRLLLPLAAAEKIAPEKQLAMAAGAQSLPRGIARG